MARFSVALIGRARICRRMGSVLTTSPSVLAASLSPAAMAYTDIPSPDQGLKTSIPVYPNWQELLARHPVDMVFLLDPDPTLRINIRAHLPDDIDIVGFKPSLVLNAFLLNHNIFLRKADTQKKFLERLVDSLPLAAVIFDQNGRVLIWNNACVKLTGVPTRQAVGKTNVGKAFYSLEQPLLGQLILKTLNPRDIQKSYDWPDIEIQPIPGGIQLLGFLAIKTNLQGHYQIIAQRIESGGKIIGSVELIQDLSSLHILQHQLQKQQEQLKVIISHLPFPLFQTDVHGTILFLNEAARQSFEKRKAPSHPERKSGGLFSMLPEIERTFRPHFLADLTSSMTTSGPSQTKTLNVPIDGQEWEVTCLALAEGGKAWTLMWTLQNVSTKGNEDKLNAALAMAGAISHELAQPLTAIISSAQLLATISLDNKDKARRHLDIIAREGERVLSLYQKLHSISRFQLTNYLDMQILDLSESSSSISPSKKSE